MTENTKETNNTVVEREKTTEKDRYISIWTPEIQVTISSPNPKEKMPYLIKKADELVTKHGVKSKDKMYN